MRIPIPIPVTPFPLLLCLFILNFVTSHPSPLSLHFPLSHTNLSLPHAPLPNPYPVADTDLLLDFPAHAFKPIPPDLDDQYPPISCFEKAIRALRNDFINHGDRPLFDRVTFLENEPIEVEGRRWMSQCSIQPQLPPHAGSSMLGTADSVSSFLILLALGNINFGMNVDDIMGHILKTRRVKKREKNERERT